MNEHKVASVLLTGFFLLALCTLGCLGGGQPHISTLHKAPASGAERASIEVSLLGALPDGDTVFDLALQDTEGVAVVGRRGVYRSSPDGLVPAIRFELDGEHFPVYSVAGASRRFVGQTLRSDDIRIYTASGQLELQLPLADKAGTFFRLAEGVGESEILIRPSERPRVLEVWSLDGKTRATLTTDHYITAFDAADFDGDGVNEIVLYEYPVRNGVGAFHVLRPTGESICRWESPQLIGDFTIFPWPTSRRPVLLTNPGDDYLVSEMCGEPIARLEAPHASSFRSMEATWVDNRWLVIAARGSGYWPYHALNVFDADGTPVYRDAGEGRANALTATANGFFLGIGNEARRYEIAALEP